MAYTVREIFSRVHQRYDFIFLWDLVNYFTRDELDILFSQLGERTTNNACLSMFVHTEKMMPAVPLSFRFVETMDMFLVEEQTQEYIKTQDIRRSTVESFCFPFIFDRAFLCQHNSMQENLLITAS